jgi:nitrogen fixation/metabolism regulation signal transduction histidine kinase
MDAHDYELIKKKQSFYLMLSIGANLILIFVLSQYQTKKIINPINKLNKAILSFPEEDLDMEIKDETNNYKKAVSLYERLINYFIITTIIPFVLVICSCYFISTGPIQEN